MFRVGSKKYNVARYWRLVYVHTLIVGQTVLNLGKYFPACCKKMNNKAGNSNKLLLYKYFNDIYIALRWHAVFSTF